MSGTDWAQLLILVLLIAIITAPLGKYMANVFTGKRTLLHPLFEWLEKLSYRIGNINPSHEMHWKEYLKALLLFNCFGFGFLFLIQSTQQWLPLNPQNFPNVSVDLAINTAASFTTNTNWQAYAGETTLSYASQMLGLTVQNFLSAATGMAVLLVLIRGFTRKVENTIGNYWVDLVRTVTYLLIPLSIVLAIVLVSQGVIQTLSPYVQAETVEGQTQTIPLGPAASQVAIKQLGTNGGGFFNANSSHPFENPTPFSNFLETLAIILIPAASTYMYGVMTNARKHGWMLFILMLFLCCSGIVLSLLSEHTQNPILDAVPLLEGIETRFGVTNSIIWSVSTTATSNGSINAMLSSLSPLAGGVALFNIMLGEVIFGGVGVGMCAMIMFILLTVFLSGLMVGRTPEYLGKKIERREIQWVMIAVLMPGLLILAGTALSIALPQALSSLSHDGPHGLSEMLYAFSSAAGNNGSAFAGLNANTLYFNLILSVVMLSGRLAILVPSVALAGLLAQKKITPPSIGTFSINTFLFIILLCGVILIVGALTFFPALSLGPIVEHFLMKAGRAI